MGGVGGATKLIMAGGWEEGERENEKYKIIWRE